VIYWHKIHLQSEVIEEAIMLNIIPGTEQMTTLVWEIFMHHTLPERPRREFCSLPWIFICSGL